MANLQELTCQQINEAIQAGTERNVPATVTIQAGRTWENLQSRLMALRGEHVLIAMPAPDGAAPAREFAPADKIGVSFKLKHHKHIFTATVAGTDRLGEGAPDPEQPVLSVCWPTRMHRLQRRAFHRVQVPPNRIIRAAFWLGGRDCEPAGTSPEQPVWSGHVTDLSAGGFQIVAADDPTGTLDVGETVGVRLVFGTGRNTVFADAQFRHAMRENGQLVMGFQFLGLAHTPQGRQALQVLSTKVGELQRMEGPQFHRRGAS